MATVVSLMDCVFSDPETKIVKAWSAMIKGHG